jgi:hypothetical protein
MFTSQPTLLIGPSDWDEGIMPREEFGKRIAALWHAHPDAPCAIVYGDRCHHAELAYLTNFTPKLEAAVALLFPSGEHEVHVGGGPNMVGAARPLTWITELKPLRGGEPIGRRAAESRTTLPGAPLLIGGDYMPTALRQGLIDAIGEPLIDATAQVWALMRRSSSNYELLAMYNTGVVLSATIGATISAMEAGAGVTDAILAGERTAYEDGAQDVRTLFSLNGGRTLVPFTEPINEQADPLQFYVAVRQSNYWAEGFYITSARPQPAFKKADELLQLALAEIKPGVTPADLEARVAAAMEPYRWHPVTEGALVSRIGIALEERPYTNAATPFEAWEFCSMRVGITDEAESHAIVSAMIRVRDDGALDEFWSGASKPIQRRPIWWDKDAD